MKGNKISKKINSLELLSLFIICGVFISSCEKNDPLEDRIIWPGPLTPEAFNPTGIKFMVLSDLHVMDPSLYGESFEEYNKYGACRLGEESNAIFDAALEKIKAYQPELLFITGDLSNDGEESSHQLVAGKLTELKELGIKTFVVPGNHDMNNKCSRDYSSGSPTPVNSIDNKGFIEIYKDFGYGESSDTLIRRENSLDYMVYPIEGLAVIGMNSTKENDPNALVYVEGELSETQVQWIEQMTAKAHRDGRYVILLMHHNLINYFNDAFSLFSQYGANCLNKSFNNAALIRRLSTAKIDIVFTGHSHFHSITHTTNYSDGFYIFDVCTSALANYPIAFRKGYIKEDGIMRITSDFSLIADHSDWKESAINLHEDMSNYAIDSVGVDMIWDLIKEYECFENKEQLKNKLHEILKNEPATFITLISEGNEQNHEPQQHVDKIMDIVDEMFNCVPKMPSFVKSIAKTKVKNIASSACYNYLVSRNNVIDDYDLEIQLHK